MSDPITWKHLQSLNCTYLKEKMPRDPVIENIYNTRYQEVDFKKNIVEKTQKFINAHGVYWLCDNDFPYLTMPGITHKILWFRDPLSMKSCKALVAKELDISHQQIVVCCNEQQLKSVPEVEHYHVFIKEHNYSEN